MTTTIPKTRVPIDNDVATRLLIDRYRQLDGYRASIEEEMVELREKLRIRAEELHADELTIGGRNTVVVSHFNRLAVSAKEIAARYPRIFEKFGSITPVTRVVVR